MRKGATEVAGTVQRGQEAVEQAADNSQQLYEGTVRRGWWRAREERDWVIGGVVGLTTLASWRYGKFATVRNVAIFGGLTAYMVRQPCPRPSFFFCVCG